MSFKEAFSLKETFRALEPNSLIVLDLDNTLIECTTSFGSYQWIAYLIRQAVKKGEPFQEALDRLVPIWEDLQKHLEMQKIEKPSSTWLADLKKQGHLLLGLTGRSSKLKEVTLSQLDRNGLGFSTWPEVHSGYFDELNEVGYQDGVIFVGPNLSKGDVLSHLLKQIERTFNQVIFVDDQKSYVKEVADSIKSLGLKFSGYHFKGVIDKVMAFDYQKALKEKELLFNLS